MKNEKKTFVTGSIIYIYLFLSFPNFCIQLLNFQNFQREKKESSDEEFFYYDEEDSLDRLESNNYNSNNAFSNNNNNILLNNSKTSLISDSLNSINTKAEAVNSNNLQVKEEGEEELGLDCHETSVYDSATSSSSLNSSQARFESSDYEPLQQEHSTRDAFLVSNPNSSESEEEEEEGENEDEDEEVSSSLSDPENVSNNTTLDEEDLEAKKLQIQRQAERLLKKNKKLRRNFALTADCMIANIAPTAQEQNSNVSNKATSDNNSNEDEDDEVVAKSSSSTFYNLSNSNSSSSLAAANESFDQKPSQHQQPLRKSQRKRQTNKKFADDEYALEDNGDFAFEENTANVTNETRNKLSFKLKSASNSSLKQVKSELNSNIVDSPAATPPTDEAATLVVLPGKVTLEAEKKGELKLRIKRIVAPNNSCLTSSPSANSALLVVDSASVAYNPAKISNSKIDLTDSNSIDQPWVDSYL